MPESEDRPTGFLRKNDREYLENPEGYGEDGSAARQTRYQRRKAIKKRFINALIDITYIKDNEHGRELIKEALADADIEQEDIECVGRSFAELVAHNINHELTVEKRTQVTLSKNHVGYETRVGLPQEVNDD
jgi:hypothetical protein